MKRMKQGDWSRPSLPRPGSGPEAGMALGGSGRSWGQEPARGQIRMDFRGQGKGLRFKSRSEGRALERLTYGAGRMFFILNIFLWNNFRFAEEFQRWWARSQTLSPVFPEVNGLHNRGTFPMILRRTELWTRDHGQHWPTVLCVPEAIPRALHALAH